MRTHVELDAGVEMRSFDALERLRRDYAWAIDIELCVFPQEGLTNNKRSDELLVQALKRGARVIGAAPNYDPDKSGQIRRIFELAREYDADIDMHLDSGNSPADMDIHLVCELTKRIRPGRTRRGWAWLQVFDAAARGFAERWPPRSPTPAWRSPCCPRPICT